LTTLQLNELLAKCKHLGNLTELYKGMKNQSIVSKHELMEELRATLAFRYMCM